MREDFCGVVLRCMFLPKLLIINRIYIFSTENYLYPYRISECFKHIVLSTENFISQNNVLSILKVHNHNPIKIPGFDFALV